VQYEFPLNPFDTFNSKYAIVRSVSGAILYTPPHGRPELLRTSHWQQRSKNEFAIDPQGKRVRLSELWLSSLKRRSYSNLAFQPLLPPLAGIPDVHGELEFNMWPGFAIQPSSAGSCQLFLDHLLNVVSAGDPELFRWIEMWLAAMFQRPDRLPGTAFAMRGVQGAGKSVVGDILSVMLGPLQTALSDPNELTGRFNGSHEGKLLLCVDEAFFAGDPRNIGRLKHMITSPTIRVEKKGIESYEIGNYARLLISSKFRLGCARRTWRAPLHLRPGRAGSRKRSGVSRCASVANIRRWGVRATASSFP